MTEQRMTNAEAVMLCRMAKAACPQQQFDQYTPDMWHELLGDLRFEDARAALVTVVKSQPFVSPAEIRGAIERVRKDRLAHFGYIRPPVELDDNWAAQQRWIIETKRRIADGEVTSPDELEDPSELLARVMPDWQQLMPAPEYVSRSQIVAETKRAKSPDFDRNLENVRAELAGRPEIPMREPETPLTDEPTEETA